MKIAVPTKEGNHIDNHFGHCEFFTVYTISEGKEVVDKKIVESPKSCGCKSNIADDLAAMDVKIMLAGGIGDGAINKLGTKDIDVIRNCKGDVDILVKEYLAGNLKDTGTSCAAHAHGPRPEDHVCNH